MESDQSLSVHLCQAMPQCNGVSDSLTALETSSNFMEEYTCKLKGIKVGSQRLRVHTGISMV